MRTQHTNVWAYASRVSIARRIALFWRASLRGFSLFAAGSIMPVKSEKFEKKTKKNEKDDNKKEKKNTPCPIYHYGKMRPKKPDYDMSGASYQ